MAGLVAHLRAEAALFDALGSELRDPSWTEVAGLLHDLASKIAASQLRPPLGP